ncbi:hypothetical protein ScPMuIL_008898 [Solemya velum]
MSITKVEGGLEELYKILPPDLQPLPISKVDQHVDGKKVYVKGRILTKLQLQKNKLLQFLKLIVTDDLDSSTESSISVFLAGEIAGKAAPLEKKCALLLVSLYSFESVIAVSGFTVESATQGVCCKNSFQIIVDSTTGSPAIWYIPHDKPVQSSTNRNTTTRTDKRISKATVKAYTYTVLNDVQPSTEVNVYGVVKFCKPPHRTRGSDYCMMLSLVDPSLGTLEDKLKCMLFNRDEKCLPPASVGSIVRFHRLKISTYRGEKQGQICPGFSWLVFSKQQKCSSVPKSSSSNYTLTSEDRSKVEELRTWLDQQEQLKDSDRKMCMSDISPGIYFDLAALVISTCDVEDGYIVLRVWDGTRTIYPVRQIDTDTENCRVQTDQSLMAVVDGASYDVFVFDDHCRAAKDIKPGQFILLCNLHSALVKNVEKREGLAALPTVELVLHRGTSYGRGLGVLAVDSEECKEITNKLEKLKNTKKHPLPSTSTAIPLKEASIELTKKTSQVFLHTADQLMIKDNHTHSETKSCLESGSVELPRKKRRQMNSVSSLEENSQLTSRGNISVSMDESEIQLTCENSAVDSSVPSSSDRCMLETASVALNHPHIKMTTLDQVLSHEVPSKFRIQSRVVDYYPHADSKEEFIKLYCPICHYLCGLETEDKLGLHTVDKNDMVYYVCPACLDTDEDCENCLDYIYMLRFLLSDGHSWLMAHLWRQEAVTFLKDLEPIAVLLDESKLLEIQDYFKQICPPDVALADKPFIECCIKSYNTKTGTSYQIFDTCIT